MSLNENDFIKLMEESLEDRIGNLLNLEKFTVKQYLSGLTFSDYFSLSSAVNDMDLEAIREILGITVESNSYSTAAKEFGKFSKPSKHSGSDIPDKLKTGDKVSFSDKDGNDIEGEVVNYNAISKKADVKTDSGNQELDKDDLSMIDELKNLAGISNETTTAGGIATVSAPIKPKKRKGKDDGIRRR